MRLVTCLLSLSLCGFAQTEPVVSEQSKPQATDSDVAKPADKGAGEKIMVPSGTKVLLVMKNSVSSRNARPGDGVYLETSFPVVEQGVVVIPAGTYVQGVVDSVKRSGRVKGRAEILLHFTSLIYPNGYTVLLAGAPNSTGGDDTQRIKDDEGTIQAEGTKGRDAATVATTTGTGTLIGAGLGRAKGAGIGAGVGAAAGVLTALFTRGEEVRLDPGATVEMVVQRAIAVDAARIVSEGRRDVYLVSPPQRKRSDRPVLTLPTQGPLVRD